MKKTILVLLALLSCIFAPAREWSLDSCISHAIAHNTEVQAQILAIENARLDISDAQNTFLPRLSGYASQNFNFGRGLTSSNTYANRNGQSFSAGVNMNVPLFQGLSDVRQLSWARIGLKQSLAQLEAVKDNVTLNVISQYLQALYCQEMCHVARERVFISRNELARRETLLELGKIPELDLAQARSQLAQDELSLVNASNDSILALLDLAQMLNLPDGTEMQILPLTADESAVGLLAPEEVYARALETNNTLKAAKWGVESAEKRISIAQSGYLPTLSLSAGLGSSYYYTNGMDNERFGDQMRHNFAQNIGFSLSVPLFDGLSTRNNVRRAKVQKLNAELTLENTRQQLSKAITMAYTQAQGAVRKRFSAETALAASAEAFRAVQEKYNFGRATATEFEQAKAEYSSAKAESVQARYEQLLRAYILEYYANPTRW